MTNRDLTEERLRETIEKARQAAERADTSEPRASSAYYDLPTDQIVIHLKNGATFSFPSILAQGLVGASPEELVQVEVTPAGDGLHWEALDVDLSILSLLAGSFGNQAWMAKLNRQEVA